MALKIGGLYRFVGGNWAVYLNNNCDTTGLRRYDTNGLRRNDLFVVVSFEADGGWEILFPKNGKLGFVYGLGDRDMARTVVLLSEGKEK